MYKFYALVNSYEAVLKEKTSLGKICIVKSVTMKLRYNSMNFQCHFCRLVIYFILVSLLLLSFCFLNIDTLAHSSSVRSSPVVLFTMIAVKP